VTFVGSGTLRSDLPVRDLAARIVSVDVYTVAFEALKELQLLLAD
jgi:hypothetical protein